MKKLAILIVAVLLFGTFFVGCGKNEKCTKCDQSKGSAECCKKDKDAAQTPKVEAAKPAEAAKPVEAVKPAEVTTKAAELVTCEKCKKIKGSPECCK